jgi:hypothetical protein
MTTRVDFIDFVVNSDTRERNIKGIYNKVLRLPIEPSTIRQHLIEFPNVLCKLVFPMDQKCYFDFIYDKYLNDSSTEWKTLLLEAIEMLNTVEGAIDIKMNKQYILRLQSCQKSHNKIFEAMVESEFYINNEEFLCYSLAARGELDKLKVLGECHTIEEMKGVLATALRYGRYHIIEHILLYYDTNIANYGKVVNFEHYIEDNRYLVYVQKPLEEDQCFYPPIQVQDYIRCFDVLMDAGYTYPITATTVEIWCNVIREKKQYSWDKYQAEEIIRHLLSLCDDEIPKSYDFGEFNQIIFGSGWVDRVELLKICENQREQILSLCDKYERLYDLYQSIRLRQ